MSGNKSWILSITTQICNGPFRLLEEHRTTKSSEVISWLPTSNKLHTFIDYPVCGSSTDTFPISLVARNGAYQQLQIFTQAYSIHSTSCKNVLLQAPPIVGFFEYRFRFCGLKISCLNSIAHTPPLPYFT